MPRPLAMAALFAALAATSACDARDPCRKLADIDCALHGEDSAICRDARRLAETADPYLTEVCRAQLDGVRRDR